MTTNYEDQISHASRLGVLFSSLFIGNPDLVKTIVESLQEKFEGDITESKLTDQFGDSYEIKIVVDENKNVPLVIKMLVESNFMGTYQRHNKDKLIQEMIKTFETNAIELLNPEFSPDYGVSKVKHIIIDFDTIGRSKVISMRFYGSELFM